LDGAPEGTSFAAPRVGAAAIAAIAAIRTSSGGVTAAQLRARLLAGAAAVPCARERADAVRRHEDAAAGAGALRSEASIVATLRADASSFAGADRVRLELPGGLGPVRLRAALVFSSAAGAHPLDPARARADLDLRVVDAAGATLAASRSFDDDEEVVTFPAESARAVVVERANGEAILEAHVAVAIDAPAAACVAR
jgi:hypothetical protein